MMKVIIGLMVFISSVNLFAEELRYTFDFSKVSVNKNSARGKIFLDDLKQTLKTGEAVLPVKLAKILLPSGIKIENVRVSRRNIHMVDNLESLNVNANNFDETISVSINDLDKSDRFSNVISYQVLQKLHGYNVLVVKMHPAYITEDGKVGVAKKLVLKIDINNNAFIAKSEVENINRLGDVLSVVDNGKDFERSYIASDKTITNGYDYLILSSRSLISYKGSYDLEKYKNFITKRYGLNAKIVDVEDAINSVNGRDRAEKLRNYLRKEYNESNVKYVLLAADSDGRNPIIPVRRLFASVRGYDGNSWTVLNQQIPSDFYYSCLDGSFNEDGDSKWGELNDGPNGQDVDFLCELTVGRWSVDNSTELEMTIKKTLQGHDAEKREKNVLFLGEVLFENMDLWGGDYLDDLIGTVTDHNFTTNGYDSSWNISKLYDKDYRWSGNTAKSKIKTGNFLIVNHLGHSNTSYNMKLSSWWFSGFSNPLPYFFYSQGCFAGDFVNDASIVEKMMFKPGGPFASVANSVYGLGPEDPAPETTVHPGTSQILHRFFTNRILGENYFKFGLAHQKSKEDMLVYIDSQEARWVNWTATFFGDPVL